MKPVKNVTPALASDVVPVGKLSVKERNLRDKLIADVKRGLEDLARVADALRSLRDGRLYRETHRTWVAFCRDTFGMTRRHVDRKIRAADTMLNLEHAVRAVRMPDGNYMPADSVKKRDVDVPFDTEKRDVDVSFLPEKEAQLLELSAVPEERQPDVWQACVKHAGGKQPPLRLVRQVVGEVLGRKSAQNPVEKDRQLILKAHAFLRHVSKPSKEISAVIEKLSRWIDNGAAKSAQKKGQ
ncbi:MAG: hypothetical protein LBK99_14275 [Opitutaceae bacterium]|jgi:hypothetical protein|nr:hypothetical protein [Opitutaceae bacterium]